MLFPIDHGNSAMKTVNFVFPSGLIDKHVCPVRTQTFHRANRTGDAGIRW